MSEQPGLFPLPEVELQKVPPRPEDVALASLIPAGIRFGTMSWNYKGWIGRVYADRTPEKLLAERGLSVYATHPLLRTVEIDRSYYEPLSSSLYADFAAQVPEDFGFVVKAHEDCVVARYPSHARYGKKKNEVNALFLDSGYATDAVVRGVVEGLGRKAMAILFQFPPQDVGEARDFADALHRFLGRLPRGVVYAIELRNRELLTPDYFAALLDAGAVHCHNIWPGMPFLLHQAKVVPPAARRPLLVRWLMREGDAYAEANARFAPFDRLVSEDLDHRDAVAHLVTRAHFHGVESVTLVDNKAEGCSPESILRLARSIASRLGAAAG